ncbi:MAG: hypothetical protein ABSH27_04690 [Solirubrobacteraceae bacterium]|jgi:hypothetical protein
METTELGKRRHAGTIWVSSEGGLRRAACAVLVATVATLALPAAAAAQSPSTTTTRNDGSPPVGPEILLYPLVQAQLSLVALPRLDFANAMPGALSATEGEPFSGQLVQTDACVPLAAPTINWGDGTPASQGTTIDGGVDGTHTYAAAGIYDGTVSYRDDCNSSGATATFQVVVADAPLTATGTTIGAVATQSVSATVATFVDANPEGTIAQYSALINWGDGSQSAGLVSAAGAAFAVSGSHTFAGAGNYAITVTITDVGGATATADTTASVSSAVVHLPSAGSIKAGGLATLDGTGSRTGALAVSSFDWTISGPGVLGGSATASCGGGDSELQTSFMHAGAQTVTLRVTYASGLVSTVSSQLELTGGRAAAPRSPNTHLSQWFLCLRGPGDPTVTPTAGGGPPPGCQDEYTDGLIDIVGCLSPVTDISQVPAAEQFLLNAYCYADGNCAESLSGPSFHVPTPAGLAGVSGSGFQNCLACSVGASRLGPVSLYPPFLLATSTVRINGLDVSPARGAVVVLDTNDGRLVSSNATVSLLDGKLPLRQGRLWLPTYSTNGDIPLLDTNLNELESQHPSLKESLDLAGFQIGGTLSVELVHAKSMITVGLTLPASLTDGSGQTVTSTLTATADNADGLVLDDLLVKVPAADIAGALEFDDLAFCYQQHIAEGFCQKQTGADFGAADPSNSSWNATGKVNLLGVGIDAVPPPADQGIGFVNGSFAFGGVTVNFGQPGIPLGDSGLNLESIAAGLGLQPTRFSGMIGLTAAGIASIDGQLFMVFGSPADPYTFTGSELGNCCSLPTQTTTGFAFAAGGDVEVTLPIVGEVTLANGWLMYVYPDYLAAYGDIGFNLLGGALELDGSVSAQIAPGSGQFDAEGKVHVHVVIFDATADAVVSSAGIGACGSITISYFVGSTTVSAGVGYHWGDSGPSFSIGSCDLSPYRVDVSAASAADASTHTVHVPAGLPNEMIKLVGVGGAPDISITGPDGLAASTANGAKVFPKPFAIFRVAQQDVTYVAIIHPPAGDYTIRANTGSPAIAQVLQADGISPSVTARVSGTGDRLRLLYTVKPEPAQRVAFFERAAQVYHLIGSTENAHGALAFTPAPGPAGKRQIVAEVTQSGAPVSLTPSGSPTNAADIVVATYSAAGPRRLGRVGRLIARHTGTTVVVKFDGVPGASRYDATLSLSNGERVLYVVNGHALTIRGVSGDLDGKVTVEALGNDATTRDGPSASVQIPRARGD